MTSEPVVGVVLGRQVVGKMTLIYICLPFPSPTPQSQLSGTSSYYRFRCHYPLITYLKLELKDETVFLWPCFACFETLRQKLHFFHTTVVRKKAGFPQYVIYLFLQLHGHLWWPLSTVVACGQTIEKPSKLVEKLFMASKSTHF